MLLDDEEELLAQGLDDLAAENSLDEASQKFVDDLVARTLVFMEALLGYPLFPYQRNFAARIIESVAINDGEQVTALFSRQSGKSETVAAVVATLMILLPKLAPSFPETLGKFKNGIWIGVFGPVEEQAETLFSRIVTRLTSDEALEILGDPEIDDQTAGGGKMIRLKKSGSFCRMQTANPRAKIESKSYHLVIVDEAQDADDYVVRKSIHPMLAFYNGTIVKTGTPTTRKGDFYQAIQMNKRRQTKRGARRNHFQADWRECAKYNENYRKFIKREILRLGQDSDEFQLSYELKWLLDRGMFVGSGMVNPDAPEFIGDKSMPVVRQYYDTPVVVGIDPARTMDSTVVTVVWVDWDQEDALGFREHRVLNWLELHGEEWETQYFEIVDFLAGYDVLAIGVDANGMGDAVAERLALLMPRAKVHKLGSTRPDQSKRWKHLQQLIQRRMVTFPAHAKTRRLRTYRRFAQQMEDLEKQYVGGYLLAAAPEEAEAHDDYPDSLAIACVLTEQAVMPTMEVHSNPFVRRSR